MESLGSLRRSNSAAAAYSTKVLGELAPPVAGSRVVYEGQPMNTNLEVLQDCGKFAAPYFPRLVRATDILALCGLPYAPPWCLTQQ